MKLVIIVFLVAAGRPCMQKTCLIAAHDPWLIQLFRIYTEECGFSVVQAFESQDVLPLAVAKQPFIILLQMDLPGPLRGLDILHAVRREASLAHTIMMIFSWQGQPDEIREESTFQLQDPITFDAFLDVLVKAGIELTGRNHSTKPVSSGAASNPNGRRKTRK
jgi:CheY-like chemotaxis protein